MEFVRMTHDAKAAEKQRLAEALRANLRRRKTAQGTRAASEIVVEKDGPRETQNGSAS